jgi:hypothetical protein
MGATRMSVGATFTEADSRRALSLLRWWESRCSAASSQRSLRRLRLCSALAQITRTRQLSPLGRVAFVVVLAIVARPFVYLFDRIADALYRPREETAIIGTARFPTESK